MGVLLDERSAGFLALGLCKATGRPVPVLTTSGTAAAELHPAVLEAFHGSVPLVAVTADRPPELHGVGAPQTCRQNGLFSGAVRWEHDPGVARAETAGSWRSMAARCLAEALASPHGPGPVHLNLPFVEPLVGESGALPPARAGNSPWHQVLCSPRAPGAEEVAAVTRWVGRRGLLVAGECPGTDPAELGAALVDLADALGWPLLADPLSGARARESPGLVTAADSLLRAGPFAAAAVPEVVLRIGRPWASRVLAEWLGESGAAQLVVDPCGTWPDPQRIAETVLGCDPVALCRQLASSFDSSARDSGWLRLWTGAESAATSAIAATIAEAGDPCEPAILRAVAGSLRSTHAMVVASSMPVRELEWFAARVPARVFANRGLNGIDGTLSTSLGVARSGRFPATVAVVGDLAFFHDAGALLAARPGDGLTVVVVDNRGGGIFDFLPQATSLPAREFEDLLRTPQIADPLEVAAAYRVVAQEVGSTGELSAALDKATSAAPPQPTVLVCRVAPGSTSALHRRIEEAVAVSVDAVLR